MPPASDSLNVEYQPGGKRIRVRRFLKPPLAKRGRAV